MRKMLICIMLVVVVLSLFSSCSYNETDSEKTKKAPVTETQNSELKIVTEKNTVLEKEKADKHNNTGSIATSGGCIAQHNYSYYFSNPNDNNKLYKMDKSFQSKKKLSDINNSSNRLQIQFIDNTLYYLNYKGDIKDNTYVGTLYSYDLTTNTESSVSEQNICSYCVYNDFIFYSTFDEHKIYRMKSDGSNVKEIYSDNSFFPQCLQVYKNKLYSCYDESLLQIDLNDLNINSFCLYPHKILIYNDHIYFTSDNDGLRVIDMADMAKIDESEKILIFDDIIDFTIFDNRLCYSTNDDKIYVSDIEGKNLKFICNGTKPIILNDILFYYDLEGLFCHIFI